MPGPQEVRVFRRVQRIAGALIAVQGAGHTFVGTPMFFRSVSRDAVWFAGAGLAMIFLGLLNLAPAVALPPWLRWGIVLGNALWLGLMVCLLSTSLSPRVIAAVVFAAVCTAGSLGGAVRSGDTCRGTT